MLRLEMLTKVIKPIWTMLKVAYIISCLIVGITMIQLAVDSMYVEDWIMWLTALCCALGVSINICMEQKHPISIFYAIYRYAFVIATLLLIISQNEYTSFWIKPLIATCCFLSVIFVIMYEILIYKKKCADKESIVVEQDEDTDESMSV